MKTPVAVLLLAGVMLGASYCNAEIIHNQRRGYALALPEGWTLNRSEKDFTVRGPNGVELAELPLPAPPTQSLKEVTEFSAQSFVLIWGCTRTPQAFDLSGEKWKGQVVVLDLPRQQNKSAKQIVLFVAKSGKDFRQFYFSIPTEEWRGHTEHYLAILRALQFPDKSK